MKRTWKRLQGSDVLNMVNHPDNCPLWVFSDIDPDYLGDFDDSIEEKDDLETEESKQKDRSKPWVVRTSKHGRSFFVGPRHGTLIEALRWAENFALEVTLVMQTSVDTPFTLSEFKNRHASAATPTL